MTDSPSTSPSASTPTKQRRHDTDWGVFAYVALILVVLAVAWALVLSTVMVDRNGSTTAQVLQLATTTQHDAQRDVAQLHAELDDTRAAAGVQLDEARTATTREVVQTRRATERELAETRAQAAATTERLADLVEADSAGWQQVVRSISQDVADASRRRVQLVETALRSAERRLDRNEAALRRAVARGEAAARAAVTRAERRAAALVTAARADVIRAEQRAAADLRRLQAAGRAVVQAAAASMTRRLERLEALLEELIHHLPRPPSLEADLAIARDAAQEARMALVDLTAALPALSGRPAEVAAFMDRLRTLAEVLLPGEQALARVRARLDPALDLTGRNP